MPPKGRKRSMNSLQKEKDLYKGETDSSKDKHDEVQDIIDLTTTNETLIQDIIPENIFHDYDFDNFWVKHSYSTQNYIEKTPGDSIIAEVEKKLGYKLPKAYIDLCRNIQNGGLVKKTKKKTGKPWPVNRVYIDSIFAIGKSKTYSLCGKMGSEFWCEEWGYPKIGVYFASCPSGGHDMVCLDYSKCGPQGEPRVVHIDQEGNYRKTVIAKTFEEFIRGLEYSDSMGIPQDEIEENEGKSSKKSKK